MAAVRLVILDLAFLVSILFNLLQLKWRNEERGARAGDNVHLSLGAASADFGSPPHPLLCGAVGVWGKGPAFFKWST